MLFTSPSYYTKTYNTSLKIKNVGHNPFRKFAEYKNTPLNIKNVGHNSFRLHQDLKYIFKN